MASIEALKNDGRPFPVEAAPFFQRYISLVPDGAILDILADQLVVAEEYLSGVTEASSLGRYAADKWSVRQVISHMADTERIFTFRALWFARGLAGDLHGFDQEMAVAGAEADMIPLARHLEELRRVRSATLSLFGNLPAAAWQRTGIASGHSMSVRAIAWISAGHVAHHLAILRERYM